MGDIFFTSKKKSDAKYRRSKKGLVRRLYSMIKRRVRGGNCKNPDMYLGLELMSKEDFIAWADSSIEFHGLHQQWLEGGYDTRLTPSVDRIDSSMGYTLVNVRWVTHAQNSLLAVRKRWSA